MEARIDRDDIAGKVAIFLTGAIVGATVALLFAPKAGKDTRRYISDSTRRGRDAVAETSGDIVDAGRDMFERGRRIVEDASELFERGRKLVRG